MSAQRQITISNICGTTTRVVEPSVFTPVRTLVLWVLLWCSDRTASEEVQQKASQKRNWRQSRFGVQAVGGALRIDLLTISREEAEHYVIHARYKGTRYGFIIRIDTKTIDSAQKSI